MRARAAAFVAFFVACTFPSTAWAAPAVDDAGTTATDAGDDVTNAPMILEAIPDGWYLLGARPAQQPVGTVDRPFYARSKGDGRALTIGTLSCDGGCSTLSGKKSTVRVPSGGTVIRNGRFAWLMWSNDREEDAVNYVAGRDISNRELVTATRGANTDQYGQVIGIRRTGLPHDLREVATSPAGPFGIPYGAEHITLLRADGGAAIDVWAYQADRNTRRAQQFWSQQATLVDGQLQPPGNSSHSGTDPVLVESGERVAVVVGAADRGLSDQIGRSLRSADDQQWAQFRSKVLELPARAMLPGATGLREPFAVDGTVGELRWAAIGASTDAGPNELYFAWVTPDSNAVEPSSGLLNSGRPMTAGVLCGALQPLRLELPRAPTAFVSLGVAPAETARATFQAGDGDVVEATVGPVTSDGLHRYLWAVLGSPSTPTLFAKAVAYDSAGATLAQTSSFGDISCP